MLDPDESGIKMETVYNYNHDCKEDEQCYITHVIDVDHEKNGSVDGSLRNAILTNPTVIGISMLLIAIPD